MTHKILVSDKLSEDGLDVFRAAGFEVDHLPEITQEEIAERIGQYDAWVIRSRSKATAEILARADRLRVVGRAGVGVDNVDIAAASARGVIVMNTPGGNTISTAEHTIAMIMSAARMIPQAHASMASGLWDKKSFMGVELQKKTLGIIGFGRIGQEVAVRMKAFDMAVMASDPFVSEDRGKQLGVALATIDEIVEKADFITLHAPLSPETKNVVNAERIARMRKGVRIVNCARGGLVDEAALAEALCSGKVAAAAFDVFEKEPLPDDSPLRGAPNMIHTPHIAASTTEAQENVAIQVAEQIVDVLANDKVRNAINAPSIAPEVLRALHPYLQLCEKLGRFAAQFETQRVRRITCIYSGSVLDYPTEPLTTAFAKGWIEPTTDRPVNYVNALPILRERGIEILETRSSHQFRYSNLLTIETEHEDGSTNSVSGSVFDASHGRLVRVNDKAFVAHPAGNMVVIENEDVPGIIGSVGTYFGNKQVNIAEMTWGRRENDPHAMTIINIDGEVSPAMLDEIRALPNIVDARLIRM